MPSVKKFGLLFILSSLFLVPLVILLTSNCGNEQPQDATVSEQLNTGQNQTDANWKDIALSKDDFKKMIDSIGAETDLLEDLKSLADSDKISFQYTDQPHLNLQSDDSFDYSLINTDALIAILSKFLKNDDGSDLNPSKRYLLRFKKNPPTTPNQDPQRISETEETKENGSETNSIIPAQTSTSTLSNGKKSIPFKQIVSNFFVRSKTNKDESRRKSKSEFPNQSRKNPESKRRNYFCKNIPGLEKFLGCKSNPTEVRLQNENPEGTDPNEQDPGQNSPVPSNKGTGATPEAKESLPTH
jgi:hypothetical protein